MKTFIRVVELWVPDQTRTRLEFGGSLHSGEFTEFNEVSENALFAYDEGLPGKAWASGHPVILTEFANSYFKRTDEAREAGLTCGVALPVFAGEFLMAVMVLLCGDDRKHVGAIELWHNDPDRSHEMALVDGYYGTADMFEFNSRHTKFPRGFGLPGRTWKAGMPLIINDLHNAKGFLRWEDASEIGINCGVGIPYTTGDQTWVVTFLSAQATPIARRFEIWVPNEARSALVFHSGDCSEQSDLAALYAAKTIGRGEGSIGGVWATGMPALTEHLKQDPSIAAALARTSGMNQVVALPVIESARLKAVLAWYL
ncbi:GAF domain-containing protein [Bradyrhizobium septentrionale]|uniref:GAF domain-containing protein n=1 Tax=Bradyrhizobium septentrionale TaxID=1404411 RepID=A0A973W4K4_9BRAD|nr:GAF domain-containing protein [Bradyrhizobium septentrionale]UGY16173.1 GAF domain-containing protein [Bradyrhizobium septentrionale]UGY24808.1 GAF domain-containing protein [Bradyrhizobium septentrionale]